MGPLADLKFGPDIEHFPKTLKWIDNFEGNKAKLITNKSEDDLVYKEEVPAVEVHKNKSAVKSSMKPYQLNMAVVTGVEKLHSAKSSHRHVLSEGDARTLTMNTSKNNQNMNLEVI